MHGASTRARQTAPSGRITLPELHRTGELQLEATPAHRADLDLRALLLQPLPQEDQPRLQIVPDLRQAQRVVEPQLPVAELGAPVLRMRPEQLPEDLRRDVPDEVLAVDED